MIPERIDFGKTSDSTIHYLWTNYKEHLECKRTGAFKEYDESDRHACGFPIPTFQRQLVWTTDQKIKFIESLWLGLNPGSYTVHTADYERNGKAKKFSGWLIDGQQRLTAIQDYWEDKFKVFGLFYSELSREEVRRFHNIKFTHTEPSLWDEALIKHLYNRMAYGGVPHRPEDMAI